MQLREGTHPVLTDDGGAILDERTGRWTQLTSTAAAAVLALLATDTAEQAAERYAARYDITPAQALDDVQTVADSLTTSGLTTSGPAVRRRRYLWRWWR